MRKKVLLTLATLFMLVGCGPKDPVEPVDPKPHEHTYAETFSYDENSHWKEATCEHTMLKIEEGSHTFGSDNKCSVCGYEREVPQGVPEANRISNITSLKDYTDIYGVVVAINGDGLVISDGINNVYVYNPSHGCKVGEYVSVSGTYKEYKGVKEFDKTNLTITKLEEVAPAINLPVITLTKEVLEALASSTDFVLPAAKYKWNAQVGLSGSYKTYNLEGVTAPIEAPKMDDTLLVAGNYYDITAYYYGTSTNSGGYHCFIIEDFTKTKDDTLVVHECHHVCSVCGKCKDATCSDPVCSSKCTCIEVSENALEIVFTEAGVPSGIVAKADSTLDELTFEFNDITYGYKGCCKNDTDYGNYFFMLGKDKKAQTCLYNIDAFEKDIKSITVEPTSSASTKVVWCISLGTSKMDNPIESTVQNTGKTALTFNAGEGSFRYFNLSTLDAANNLQVKRIIIEFK